MRRKTVIQTMILAICLIHAGAAFGSGAVEFPNKAATGVQLSVGGPGGFHFSQSFKAGERVSLSLFDQAGNFLQDGLYKWEMVYQAEAQGDRDAYRAKAEPVTGVFTIRGGAVVNEKAIEGGFTKDQVFLDDLIVNGSICAGLDCNNGESFGFDTLRLKENNLRIRAQDTSTSASFPTRDWQITFNDSSNGGANKFSIDDIDGGRTPFTIEGGAPSHSLFVDDGGRLGFGTSTPVVELHVQDGNTPTLRLEQDGSNGFTPQTWDVAGNEANFFIRDATNGSTLPFKIFPGAPSNALTIEATTGSIGLGTTTPEEELDVEGNDNGGEVKVRITNLADGGNTWQLSVPDGGATVDERDFRISKTGTGAAEITINELGDANGESTLEVNGSVDATAFNVVPSLKSKKTDFVALDGIDTLAKVAGLEMTSWRFKEETGLHQQRHIGPFAGEWAATFPLGGKPSGVSLLDMSGVALSAIQGLNLKLEAENAELRTELEELRAMIAALAE